MRTSQASASPNSSQAQRYKQVNLSFKKIAPLKSLLKKGIGSSGFFVLCSAIKAFGSCRSCRSSDRSWLRLHWQLTLALLTWCWLYQHAECDNCEVRETEFHIDFKGRLERPGKEPLRGQCVKLQNEAKGAVETAGGWRAQDTVSTEESCRL